MEEYLALLRKVMQEGTRRSDRTQTGTLSVFGHQIHFDLSQGFPLLTTKKLHLRSIIYELLWFLRGETHTDYLKEHNVRIWDPWADRNGELGPIYGAQWRRWEEDGRAIDQIQEVIESIRKDPYSRRHIVSAWHVGQLEEMSLPPCHVLFQFYVAEGTLSCQLYQRSADVFIGVPFNIASYSLLTLMIAQVCDLRPGKFVHTFGDAHLYMNHLTQSKLQLKRTPFPLPHMELDPSVRHIDDFTYESFCLRNYKSHPHIAADVAL